MLVIETERLLLRDFVYSDWQAVHHWSSDPDVVRFMEWGPNSASETKNFVARMLAAQKKNPRKTYELLVTLKATQAAIGACGIRLLPTRAEQADIGYCYNKSFWQKGYATEACQALIKFGFESLGLHRIIASCDTANLGSARVLAKSGMRKEAHFYQDIKIRDKWRDSFLFAILKKEYESTR